MFIQKNILIPEDWAYFACVLSRTIFNCKVEYLYLQPDSTTSHSSGSSQLAFSSLTMIRTVKQDFLCVLMQRLNLLEIWQTLLRMEIYTILLHQKLEVWWFADIEEMFSASVPSIFTNKRSCTATRLDYIWFHFYLPPYKHHGFIRPRNSCLRSKRFPKNILTDTKMEYWQFDSGVNILRSCY